MTNTRRNFRLITLALQILAIAVYFLPPLFAGGNFGIFWLVAGVIHTAMFCTVFFRDSRRRTAISIVFMIIVILWILFLLAFGLLLLASWMHITILSAIIVYSLSSLLAVIFALAVPRKLTGNMQGFAA